MSSNGILDQAILHTSIELLHLRYRSYCRRWPILILFTASFAIIAFQYIHYTIITDVIQKYYKVPAIAVDGLTLVFFVFYIFFAIPAAYLCQKKGLRLCVFLASLFTTIGTWMKVLGVKPDLFYLTFTGQAFCAFAEVFIYGIPPRVAAVWFGSHELSLASAIGVLGQQIGVVLGFYFTPILVPLSGISDDEIEHCLFRTAIIIAGISTAIFILICLVFQEAPQTAPSAAAELQFKEDSVIIEHPFFCGYLARRASLTDYKNQLMNIFTDKISVWFLVAYAFGTGVVTAFAVQLGQEVTYYLPTQPDAVSYVGPTIIVVGMVGAIVFGIILDKTHKLREVCTVITFLCLLSALSFALVIQYIPPDKTWIIYILCGNTGFFFIAFLSMGYQYLAEVTFPTSEAITGCLVTMAGFVGGIPVTMVGSYLFREVSPKICNLFLTVLFFIPLIIIFSLKPTLKRYNAEKQMKEVALQEEIRRRSLSTSLVDAASTAIEPGVRTTKTNDL